MRVCENHAIVSVLSEKYIIPPISSSKLLIAPLTTDRHMPQRFSEESLHQKQTSGLRFLPCAGWVSVHPKLPPSLRVEASEAGHQDVGEELRLLKGREEETELEQQLSRAEDEWTDVVLPPSEQGPLDRAAPACSRAAESPGLGSGSWVAPSPRRTWLTGALSLLRTGFR